MERGRGRDWLLRFEPLQVGSTRKPCGQWPVRGEELASEVASVSGTEALTSFPIIRFGSYTPAFRVRCSLPLKNNLLRSKFSPLSGAKELAFATRVNLEWLVFVLFLKRLTACGGIQKHAEART